MGTNYYLVKGEHYPEYNNGSIISHMLKWGTGRPPMIHIGKSSAGWCFGLHVYPDFAIKTLDDWKNFTTKMLADGWHIEDEYRTVYTPEQLWNEVERVFWRISEDRPLLRRTIHSGICIGHGEGLYDYLVGDFS